MNDNKKNKDNKNKKDDQNNFNWKKLSKQFFFWIILFIIAIYITQLLNVGSPKEVNLSYTEFSRFLENESIASGVIKGDIFHGELKYQESVLKDGQTVSFIRFKTNLPFIDREMIKKWDSLGIQYEFKQDDGGWWKYLSFIPWLLIPIFFIYFIMRMQGKSGSKGIFNFGKSRAKLLSKDTHKVTFNDVAGTEEAKQELTEVIEFLKAPERFQKLGGKIPKGVLLLGPPGTGKTLLGKAVAGEAGVPFYSMSGADFVEMFVGVGASRVRDLFEQGKKNAPCIIFIDEIDAVGRHRGAGLGGGHDEREQTLNQLLVEMDGFETNEGVILIAATNRPDVLDKALLRRGRFDRQIVVDRPDVRGREGILKVHTKNIPLSKEVNLETIAKGTPGFSGADLANLANEAALLAARRSKKKVDMFDLEDSKDKVLMGVERKSLLISDKEKRNTAYHEAGHVLVAKLLPEADEVHKVTIIPRGRALGVTSMLPIDEKHNYTKSYCETLLKHILGGRAAEHIIFNQYTTGAGNDIEKATQLVRKMVCEWGMSEELGPITFGKKNEEIFLGREIAQHRDFSEKTAIKIDAEVKRIVTEAEKESIRLLRENITVLKKLAETLLEKEILTSEEIDKIINKKKIIKKSKAKKAKSKTNK
ncbi:MAG: ATP-dependent zinc metalloprotease FtsH [bacterium]